MLNIGKDMELLNLYTLLVHCVTILESCLTVAYKFTLALWPNNSIARNYSRETKSYVYRKTVLYNIVNILYKEDYSVQEYS